MVDEERGPLAFNLNWRALKTHDNNGLNSIFSRDNRIYSFLFPCRPEVRTALRMHKIIGERMDR